MEKCLQRKKQKNESKLARMKARGRPNASLENFCRSPFRASDFAAQNRPPASEATQKGHARCAAVFISACALQIPVYRAVIHRQTKCFAFVALRALCLPVKRRKMNMPAARPHSFVLVRFKFESCNRDIIEIR